MMESRCIESSELVCSQEPPADVSQTPFQTMIDAFPDSTMVIDLEHNVVLANRVASEVFGLGDLRSHYPKCYQAFHHLDTPCAEDDGHCPLREIVATKRPARVTHSHYDSEGRELCVEITAAPVLDDAGEVVQIVESCRDITERRLFRRLLVIGSRHMEMDPLLDEIVEELRSFTGCRAVGACALDDEGGISFGFSGRSRPEVSDADRESCYQVDRCICAEIIDGDVLSKLPFPAKGKSIHVEDCSTQLPAALPGEMGDRLANAHGLCGCNSLALVPISLGDRIIGLIHVADPRREMITAKTVSALERVAMELGETIWRVRSGEALRAARDLLETRVEERTEELTKSNRTLQYQIVERKRLEREILQVIAMEQQRIGQDLHDGVGQELTGLSYLAQSLYQKLGTADSAEIDTAAEVAHGIPLVLGKIREVVNGLVPLEVRACDLESALRALTTNVQKQTGITCRFESTGGAQISDDDTAVQIYRIAQEAVTNAFKHAEAQHIVVVLDADRDQIRLEVHDDGVGLQPVAERNLGCGLRTMNYRARAIGGTFEIGREADEGTRVACVLPQGCSKGFDVEGSTNGV